MEPLHSHVRLLHIERELEAQGAAIRELQRESDRAADERKRAQQRSLLREAAYVLAGLVEDFVYLGADTGELEALPLAQLDRKAKDGDVSSQQLLRYQQAVYTFEGIEPQQLLACDSYLRQLVHETVHSSQQQQNASLEDLLLWAGMHCTVRALGPLQQFLCALNRFTSADCPLQPDVSLQSAVG